jgi:hypothetical protein
VTWDAVTFDVTTVANNGAIAVNVAGSFCNQGRAVVFPILSGTGVCAPTNSINYVAVANGLAYQFFFQDETTGSNPSVAFVEAAGEVPWTAK